jgi:hypothetical protein
MFSASVLLTLGLDQCQSLSCTVQDGTPTTSWFSLSVVTTENVLRHCLVNSMGQHQASLMFSKLEVFEGLKKMLLKFVQ